MPNKKQLRDWGLDILVGVIEMRINRFAALISYMCIKRSVPDWKMPRWERYALFPGAIVFDLLFRNGRGGGSGRSNKSFRPR